jgi:hypothetical protein
MTLEEYEKVLEEKRKALLALKAEERKVEVDKELQSMQQLSVKKDADEVFIKLVRYTCGGLPSACCCISMLIFTQPPGTGIRQGLEEERKFRKRGACQEGISRTSVCLVKL